MKFIIPILILFLFLTARIPAQVSPVANLNQQNSPVVNNNFNYLQNSINGVQYLIQSYFPGGLVQTSNGGTGANLSTATAGYLIYMSTQDTLVAGSPASLIPHGVQTFFTPGTFTFTSPITGTAFLTGCAGGGSGAQGGPGGSAGQCVVNYPYTVVQNTGYTVVVGTGGAQQGTGSTNGNNGGSSSFGTLTLTAGLGGATGANTATLGGGANTTGVACLTGQVLNGGGFSICGGNSGIDGAGNGSGGGGSMFGAGGTGGGFTTSGGDATGYGAGGGGSQNGGGAHSGAGTQGFWEAIW